jgi:putative aldouronate transport system substrate-binding protein
MKKLIAVLLAALMCASMLLACGGGGNTTTTTTTKAAEEEKTTTAAPAKEEDTTTADSGETQEADTTAAPAQDPNWPEETYHAYFILYTPNDAQTRQEQVKQHIMEFTKEDLNIECEIVPMTFATYNAQVPLMLSSGEQIDVLSVSNPQTQYEEGRIVDLMDYIDIIKDAVDWIGYDEVMASKSQGRLYTLPWQLERTHRYGMAMRTDILEELGYDPATINGDINDAYDKATEIFAAVHEKYPDMTVMGGPYNSAPPTNQQHTDALTDGYGVLDNYGSTFEVTNYFESEYFMYSLGYMNKWFKAGYIYKDLATSQDSYESMVKAGNTFGGCCPMKPDSYAEKGDQCGFPMTIFYFREDMMTAYTGNPGYTIAGTAKDYVQAARLLNYVYVSRKFEDAINWGVEGVDWVEDPSDPDHNTAMYPAGVDGANNGYHNSYGWAYPNERIAHVWQGNASNMYTEIYPAAEQESHRTQAWGFIFDNSEWLDTIGALDNIKNEYLYVIGSGSYDDYEDRVKEFNDKLYAAGLAEMMAAKQEQLDAWRAENGK